MYIFQRVGINWCAESELTEAILDITVRNMRCFIVIDAYNSSRYFYLLTFDRLRELFRAFLAAQPRRLPAKVGAVDISA